jgi:WD40 repeat protein
MRVWDVNKGESIFCCSDIPGRPHYMKWSPNGKLISICESTKGINIFDIRKAKTIHDDSALRVEKAHTAIGKHTSIWANDNQIISVGFSNI